MPHYPYIRLVSKEVDLANSEEYHRIWSIWMQDHIIKWMSFRKQNEKDFEERYKYLRSNSDIYVMIDFIDGREQIVGVRRIKYLSGNYSHIAEFCSMGVDEKYLGRGYGSLFTKEFEKKVREKGTISRIQLTQSGGNGLAFTLADKNGFQEEAVFPDWLEREGMNSHHYFILERFIYKYIDPELEAQSKKIPSLQYKAKLPLLNNKNNQQNFAITIVQNKLTVNFEHKPIITFDYCPDQSVIQHIGFLEHITLLSDDQLLCQDALRMALAFLFEEKRVKKLELFVANQNLALICQELGFWVRGERCASLRYEGKYYNELGIEYSFFNISDAKNLLLSFEHTEKVSQLEQLLERCQKAITQLLLEDFCDQLGQAYLEYIVYQVLRDSLQLQNLISLKIQPWQAVINECPEILRIELYNLMRQVQQFNSSQEKVVSLTQFFTRSNVASQRQEKNEISINNTPRSFSTNTI